LRLSYLGCVQPLYSGRREIAAQAADLDFVNNLVPAAYSAGCGGALRMIVRLLPPPLPPPCRQHRRPGTATSPAGLCRRRRSRETVVVDLDLAQLTDLELAALERFTGARLAAKEAQEHGD
jgi:hypothetical protein